MKRFKASELFVSVCFLAFLFGAMTVTVAREKADYSFYENRMLASIPEYTAEADGNGSYVNQWEKYLSDHAALRSTLLKVKTRLDLALRRPVVNETVIGDGILLPYLPAQRVNGEEIAAQARAMADNLKGIQDVVAGYGGYYCYVCVTCQYDYYPDRYPGFLDNWAEQTRLSREKLATMISPASTVEAKLLSISSMQWLASAAGEGSFRCRAGIMTSVSTLAPYL